MSGVEVAGLLLGVLTIFIEGAKHYHEGLDFVKRATNKGSFVTRYRDELIQQRILLSLYIKAVVGRTDLPADTQYQLVEKPDGDAWRDSNVVKELSRELGEAYQPFVDLLAKICVSLAKQIRPLDTSSSTSNDEELITKLRTLCISASKCASPSRSEKPKIWDGIKFSWRHSERERLLTEIKAYNASLGKLEIAVSRAKHYERRQQTKKAHAAFALRNDTDRLFRVIKSTCNCSQSRNREISLGLTAYQESQNADEKICFTVLFFHSVDKFCTMAITMAENSDEIGPPKKKVRIEGLANTLSNDATNKQMRKLKDLCRESQSASNGKTSLRLLVDMRDQVFRSHAENTQQQSKSASSILSLCDTMSALKVYDRKKWFHREKSILAIILAYSLLQLHESSWWQSLWTCENIMLLDAQANNFASSCHPDQRIRLRQPFTRPIFSESDPSGDPLESSGLNAHLHALGIVLLELLLHRPLDVDAAPVNHGDRRAAAQRSLEEHADDVDMTREYFNAVRFCLSPHPNPYSGSFSFNDRGFREIYYNEVISMLEDHLASRFEARPGDFARDNEQ